MTHDELTIRIIKLSEDDNENWKFYPALRAVVELHKPYLYPEDDRIYCIECNVIYPCPTIQAIEKELGK